MSTRYPFSPESAHLPTANAAALKKDPAGRFVLVFDPAVKEGAMWQGIAPQNFSGDPTVWPLSAIMYLNKEMPQRMWFGWDL